MVDRAHGHWIIWLTIILALYLSIIPYPHWFAWARPQWVALVLVYWAIALPHRVSIGSAWIVGLLLDGLQGTVLGQNALALSVIAYVSVGLFQRMRMFSTFQQSLLVFVLLGLYQLLCHWVQTITGQTQANLLYLLPAVVSAILWPWIMLMLRWLRREFQVR